MTLRAEQRAGRGKGGIAMKPGPGRMCIRIRTKSEITPVDDSGDGKSIGINRNQQRICTMNDDIQGKVS